MSTKDWTYLDWSEYFLNRKYPHDNPDYELSPICPKEDTIAGALRTAITNLERIVVAANDCLGKDPLCQETQQNVLKGNLQIDARGNVFLFPFKVESTEEEKTQEEPISVDEVISLSEEVTTTEIVSTPEEPKKKTKKSKLPSASEIRTEAGKFGVNVDDLDFKSNKGKEEALARIEAAKQNPPAEEPPAPAEEPPVETQDQEEPPVEEISLSVETQDQEETPVEEEVPAPAEAKKKRIKRAIALTPAQVVNKPKDDSSLNDIISSAKDIDPKDIKPPSDHNPDDLVENLVPEESQEHPDEDEAEIPDPPEKAEEEKEEAPVEEENDDMDDLVNSIVEDEEEDDDGYLNDEERQQDMNDLDKLF
jgi:hypothetical protein